MWLVAGPWPTGRAWLVAQASSWRLHATFCSDAGSEEETELRSCSIQAVECLKAMFSDKDDSTVQV